MECCIFFFHRSSTDTIALLSDTPPENLSTNAVPGHHVGAQSFKAATPFNGLLDKRKLREEGLSPPPDWRDPLKRSSMSKELLKSLDNQAVQHGIRSPKPRTLFGSTEKTQGRKMIDIPSKDVYH